MKTLQRWKISIFHGLLVLLFFAYPQTSSGTPISELLSGGTFQLSGLQLSNWSLVTADNVNISNIDIRNDNDRLAVWGLNRELWVGTTQAPAITKTLKFEFMVTGLDAKVTQVKGDLGPRSVSGYSWNSPVIRGAFAVGTTQGSNDVGLLRETFSLNTNTDTSWLAIPAELESLWIRTAIVLNSSTHGYARAGWNGTEGPALLTSFRTQALTPAPVPEPATFLLLGAGLSGFVLLRNRKR